ncbi:hypothetical protein G6F62_013339 [Rhizopus arrhizus]|nr:hypothetical protein G6F62_013339 [Rhizopus arrhizus]
MALTRPGTTNAGGDVAALDDRVLHAFHHHVHAGGAQAAPRGGVAARIGGRQRPAEAVGKIALQRDGVDGEAR